MRCSTISGLLVHRYRRSSARITGRNTAAGRRDCRRAVDLPRRRLVFPHEIFCPQRLGEALWPPQHVSTGYEPRQGRALRRVRAAKALTEELRRPSGHGEVRDLAVVSTRVGARAPHI